MKTFYKMLAIAMLIILSSPKIYAQVILFQDFSGAGGNSWLTSNGSSIGSYENPDLGCANDQGIRTPGVGGNNPAKILSEVITPTLPNITVAFSISRYDANLTCTSRSDFGCNTFVDILLVSSTYSGTDPIGDGATIYANNSGYLLPISGGPVSVNVFLPLSLPQFKVFFNFSAPGNCNQPGTKYVLDNVSINQYDKPCLVTGTCPPEANDDYFKAETQGFMNSTLLANVYGTNIGYTPPLSHITYVTRSLTNGVLSPNGGVDFDVDNHALSLMSFSLLTQDFTAAEANFTFNSDGTFSFEKLDQVRLLYSFTYRLTDASGNTDDAKVTIDYRLSSTLPVSLTYFTVVKNNRNVDMAWSTALESNNVGFTVERQQNGEFTSVGFVPSKAVNGNSNATLNYTFTDNNLNANGLVSYRIKQTDLNGAVKYSAIRAVKFSNKFEVSTYPNPSTGFVNVVIPDDAGAVDISILDMNGKTVQQLKNTLLRKVTFNNLQTGLYMVKVNALLTNEGFTQKLIVK